jgi:hypothetical protein
VQRHDRAQPTNASKLRIREGWVSSKGIISFEGSGEIVEETGRLFERLAGLNQLRIALRLDNERMRQENIRDCIKDELAVTKELIQVLEEYLRLKWGEDFRSCSAAEAIIGDVLSGALTLGELMSGQKPVLLPQSKGQGD